MSEKLRKIGSELTILVGVIVFSLAARSVIVDHYYIPSESMEYSLLVGDRVLVDKRAYGLRVPFTNIKVLEGRSPERGEIVIFDSPESDVRLIKRVVAVGGDRVEVSGGNLLINGDSLSLDTSTDLEIFGERGALLNLKAGGGPDMESKIVTEETVMVMGDNRGNSRDSRAFGFIPVDDIYGRAFRLYYRRGTGFAWSPI
jgi:signal peptidase I